MMTLKPTYLFIAALLLTALFSSALTGLFLSQAYGQNQYHLLSTVTRAFTETSPGEEAAILSALKDSTENDLDQGSDILSRYGYTPQSFNPRGIFSPLALGLLSGLFLFLLLALMVLFFRHYCRKRIEGLSAYLQKMSTPGTAVILPDTEDLFSPLQDALYKTLTELRQTKELALTARREFADNLVNIAHQIKTPVTAISLTLQLRESEGDAQDTVSLKKQVDRLSRLVEALLTLSRIDTGVLTLKKQPVDVYSMLQLSADSLDPLLREKEITLKLPDDQVISYDGDMDWSVEAFINLIKNSIEHTPARGCITLSVEKNPLYVEITLCDNGSGFPEEELPHIFERFYQGAGASPGGIGIGLSLAKAIIEGQNGFVRAEN
ncbi:MAG: HAMP domain-containing sensor histidine kinase, partial [Eubacterium sp.]